MWFCINIFTTTGVETIEFAIPIPPSDALEWLAVPSVLYKRRPQPSRLIVSGTEFFRSLVVVVAVDLCVVALLCQNV